MMWKCDAFYVRLHYPKLWAAVEIRMRVSATRVRIPNVTIVEASPAADFSYLCTSAACAAGRAWAKTTRGVHTAERKQQRESDRGQ